MTDLDDFTAAHVRGLRVQRLGPKRTLRMIRRGRRFDEALGDGPWADVTDRRESEARAHVAALDAQIAGWKTPASATP